MLQETLALRRELGDQRGMVMPLSYLSNISKIQGRLEEAECWARECVAVCGEVDDRTYLGTGHATLGWVLHIKGRFAEARTVFQEGLQCLDAMESPILNLLHLGLGSLNAHQGLYKRARSRATTGLALAREMGHGWQIASLLRVLGNVALAEKQPVEAREFFLESADVLGTRGDPYDVVWPLAGLAYAARDLGDQLQSKVHADEALQLAIEMRAFDGLVFVLPVISLLLADQGDVERAVELYALASRYPIVAKSRWFEDVAGRQIAAVAATLPPDVVTAAQERGRARDLWETAEELLEELR
jgi:tetratricopeptide (TPR) repeat protein